MGAANIGVVQDMYDCFGGNYILDGTDMDKHDSSGQAGAEIEVTDAMIEAGVLALASVCPMDDAFPVGGEEIAVAVVLRAALSAVLLTCE